MSSDASVSFESVDGGVRLHVRVQPKASRNEVILDDSGRVRVAVTAPPLDNAANEAVQQVLAKKFGLPRRSVVLIAGTKGREKSFLLEGADIAALKDLLVIRK